MNVPYDKTTSDRIFSYEDKLFIVSKIEGLVDPMEIVNTVLMNTPIDLTDVMELQNNLEFYKKCEKDNELFKERVLFLAEEIGSFLHLLENAKITKKIKEKITYFKNQLNDL